MPMVPTEDLVSENQSQLDNQIDNNSEIKNLIENFNSTYLDDNQRVEQTVSPKFRETKAPETTNLDYHTDDDSNDFNNSIDYPVKNRIGSKKSLELPDKIPGNGQNNQKMSTKALNESLTKSLSSTKYDEYLSAPLKDSASFTTFSSDSPLTKDFDYLNLSEISSNLQQDNESTQDSEPSLINPFTKLNISTSRMIDTLRKSQLPSPTPSESSIVTTPLLTDPDSQPTISKAQPAQPGFDTLSTLARAHSFRLALSKLVLQSPSSSPPRYRDMRFIATITIPPFGHTVSPTIIEFTGALAARTPRSSATMKQDVVFEKAEVWSINVDAAVWETWQQRESKVEVVVVATERRLGKLKRVWVARGVVWCQEVVAGCGRWSGSVPLWLDRNDGERWVGDLGIVVEFVSDTNFGNANKSVGRAVKVEIKKEEVEELKIVENVGNAQKSVESVKYFLIQISTAQGLQIIPSTSSDKEITLCSLVVRLFSPSPESKDIATLPIETPPVPYIFPPIDQTGSDKKMFIDFEFEYVVPIHNYLSMIRGPMVVEVWVSDNVDDKKLLGIVKLPSHHLFTALMSDAVVPLAEYPIINVLTGKNKGWLSASMAVGDLIQVERRKRKPDITLVPETPPKQTVEAAVETDSLEINRESTPEPQQPNLPPTPPPPMELEITIHRLTGLRTLLTRIIHRDRTHQETLRVSTHTQRRQALRAHYTSHTAIPPPPPPPPDEYTALDYAADVGCNVYVRLELTPPHALPPHIEIMTPVYPHTFHPVAAHASIVSVAPTYASEVLQGLASGCAEGEVWHRVSRETVAGVEDVVARLSAAGIVARACGGGGWEVLLGKFDISLKRIINSDVGLWRQWIVVEDGAAIEVSIGGLGIPWNGKPVCISVDVEKVFGVVGCGEGVELLVRLGCPVKDDGVQWEQLAPRKLDNGNADFIGEERVVIDIDCNMLTEHKERVEVQVWKRDPSLKRRRHIWLNDSQEHSDDYREYLGSAFIDLRDCVMRVTDGSNDLAWSLRTTTPVAVDYWLPVIHPQSIEFVNTMIQLKATIETGQQRRRLPNKPTYHRAVPAIHHIKKIPQNVTLDVHIERAMHLPLILDPLAKIVESPFVDKHEQQLAQPNVCVSLRYPHKSHEHIATTTTVRASVAPLFDYHCHVNAELCSEYELDVWSVDLKNSSRELLGTAYIELNAHIGWYPVVCMGMTEAKGFLLASISVFEDNNSNKDEINTSKNDKVSESGKMENIFDSLSIDKLESQDLERASPQEAPQIYNRTRSFENMQDRLQKLLEDDITLSE
ncbi:hypothetical protein HK096_001123, partial [Nowakowskiella sp. JEL0078]